MQSKDLYKKQMKEKAKEMLIGKNGGGCLLHSPFNPLSLTVIFTFSELRTYVSHGIAKVGDNDDGEIMMVVMMMMMMMMMMMT